MPCTSSIVANAPSSASGALGPAPAPSPAVASGRRSPEGLRSAAQPDWGSPGSCVRRDTGYSQSSLRTPAVTEIETYSMPTAFQGLAPLSTRLFTLGPHNRLTDGAKHLSTPGWREPSKAHSGHRERHPEWTLVPTEDQRVLWTVLTTPASSWLRLRLRSQRWRTRRVNTVPPGGPSARPPTWAQGKPTGSGQAGRPRPRLCCRSARSSECGPASARGMNAQRPPGPRRPAFRKTPDLSSFSLDFSSFSFHVFSTEAPCSAELARPGPAHAGTHAPPPRGDTRVRTDTETRYSVVPPPFGGGHRASPVRGDLVRVKAL